MCTYTCFTYLCMLHLLRQSGPGPFRQLLNDRNAHFPCRWGPAVNEISRRFYSVCEHGCLWSDLNWTAHHKTTKTFHFLPLGSCWQFTELLILLRLKLVHSPDLSFTLWSKNINSNKPSDPDHSKLLQNSKRSFPLLVLPKTYHFNWPSPMPVPKRKLTLILKRGPCLNKGAS